MTIFHRICKFTRFGRILSFSLGTALLLSSCAGLKTTPTEMPAEPVSIFTGKPGGIKLSDFGTKETSSGDSMPVNALLWRAALDIASFVPLDDVDTFGGSIVTEWHQPKDTPNQRLKLTMFVLAANCVPMQLPFAPISKTGLALNGLMLAVMKRLAASWKIWY